MMAEDFHDVNYDETKVPKYELPSLLKKADGSFVKNSFEWVNFQRRFLRKTLEECLYGPVPPRPISMHAEVLSRRRKMLGGIAERKLVRLYFRGITDSTRILDLLVYLPAKRKGPAPVFAGLNFKGNHSITPEQDIPLPEFWVCNDEKCRIENNHTNESVRGANLYRWCPELIIRRGYALVTACYCQLYPDHLLGGLDSIYKLFLTRDELLGRQHNLPAISAWAWGLSRIMDYIETDPDLDAAHTAVIGHSRLGKTALWAGANDVRFRLVVSNDSGCGGAALSRRCFGETLGGMKDVFPYWFCRGMDKYAYRSGAMPYDQHTLLALTAPRPLYVASASEDLWADPRGEFLGLKAANPAYALFGSAGLPAEEMPPIGVSVQGDCGYHLRFGPHDLREEDWTHYLDFADRFRG